MFTGRPLTFILLRFRKKRKNKAERERGDVEIICLDSHADGSTYDCNDMTRVVRKTPFKHHNTYCASHTATPIQQSNTDASFALRLPPEIVGAIMTNLVQDIFFSDIHKTECLWIKVGHICRYWRQIALECPNVWSYIDTRRTALVKELVRRSNSAPLIVYVWLQAHRTVPDVLAINQALGEMHRIRELSIIGDMMDFHFPCIRLPFKAPQLKTLMLTSLERSNAPMKLLETSTTCLRNLFLYHTTIPPEPTLLRGLQDLTIYALNSPPSHVSKLLSILELCPELVEFNFSGLFDGFRHSAAEMRVVTLPRLRTIRLAVGVNAVIFLLNCLTVPIDVALSISGLYDPQSPLGQSIPPTFLITYDSLEVNISEVLQANAKVSVPTTGDTSGWEGCTKEFEMEVRSIARGSVTCFDLLPVILNCLLPRIRHLELNNEPTYSDTVSAGMWLSLLTSLHSVVCLSISFSRWSRATAFMDALSASKETQQLLCPRMRTLILQRVNFTGAWNTELSQLGAFLERRSVSPARITTLDISLCSGMFPDAVQIQIRPFVENLLL